MRLCPADFVGARLRSRSGVRRYLGAWALLPAPGDPQPRRARRIQERSCSSGGDPCAGRLGLRTRSSGARARRGRPPCCSAGRRSDGERRARAGRSCLSVIGVVVFIGNNTRGTASTLLAPARLPLLFSSWSRRLHAPRGEREQNARADPHEERADLRSSRATDSVLQTRPDPEGPGRRAAVCTRQTRVRAWLYPIARLRGRRSPLRSSRRRGDRGAARSTCPTWFNRRRAARRTHRSLVLAARRRWECSTHSGVEEVSVFSIAGDDASPLRPRPRTGFDPAPSPPTGASCGVRFGQDGARGARAHRLGARRGHRRGIGVAMSRPAASVVLVDDHDLFAPASGGSREDVEVVGEAGSVAEAVPLYQELTGRRAPRCPPAGRRDTL